MLNHDPTRKEEADFAEPGSEKTSEDKNHGSRQCTAAQSQA